MTSGTHARNALSQYGLMLCASAIIFQLSLMVDALYLVRCFNLLYFCASCSNEE